MGVLPELAKAVDDMDWMLPTDVQAEAIPLILGGGDVLMAAETGSGKTGAFCLPVLQIVWETRKDLMSGKGRKGGGPKKHGTKGFMLNIYDRGDAMAITPEGLLCQSRDQQKWHGCRATKGVTGKGNLICQNAYFLYTCFNMLNLNIGKYYYEATVTDEGLCRVGWSTPHASLDLGTDAYGFGYGGTGKKSNSKQFDNYGEAFGLSDVIGCFLDLDRKEIRFSRNGKLFEVAFKISPKLENAQFFPAVNAEIRFNFGESPFRFPASDGFVAVCEAPKDLIVDSPMDGAAAAPVRVSSANAPMCLIIEPSRELAEQTDRQIEEFKKNLDNPKIRNLVIVGGVTARDQLSVLANGVDIVTGTPGRLEEFISSGQLSLSEDGLLQQNYEHFINKVHSQIPKVTADGKRLQMVVCSATLHNFDVKKLADRLMHFPQWVDLKGQDSVPDTVHHVTDGIHYRDEIRPGSDRPETLSEAVKRLKGEYVLRAIRKNKMDQCLIFCRTKLDCDNLEKFLSKAPEQYRCVCLHGDRRPDERKRNLQLFKDKKASFLICTDVAARGIDIKHMPYVINVTLPDEKTNYLHRIGRVGRAERMGLAISLVSSVPEKVWYHQCNTRGKGCNNTTLVEQGGCGLWLNETEMLADIEEHLGVTIPQTDPEINVPSDEFDGKVVYGQKRMATGSGYKGHTSLLAATVTELAQLEKAAQTSYLTLRHNLVLK
ncbi:unnamed protein product [Soboliphyme baturini]|uniref:ATP-dependent RNA helicase n=1 Tax=Soboliphyme baturini TaxID=241478 RepID=A0A183IIX2_9BILA|nr:unnamed protein product [Soboliphyme baturini]